MGQDVTAQGGKDCCAGKKYPKHEALTERPMPQDVHAEGCECEQLKDLKDLFPPQSSSPPLEGTFEFPREELVCELKDDVFESL